MVRTGGRSEGQRIFGLDLMRAVAIVLVVGVHAGDLLDAHWPGNSFVSGIDGVDVFFVLSGYLIGSILLRYLHNNAVPWHERLFDFWRRRWLRTLPNYYLFLVINILLLHYGHGRGLLNMNALAYFAMLQNLIIPLDLFFWESWSLAVEEWFYLLFPLLLLMLSFVFRKASDRIFLVAILVFLLVPLLLRIQAAQGIHDMPTADLYIRRMVPTRLDTIGYGLLAALLHRIWRSQWSAWRMPAFIVGMVLIVFGTTLHDASYLHWVMTGQHILMAIGLALLLSLLSTWFAKPPWGAPVVLISKVSYAWYLVHMPLRYAWQGLMEGRDESTTIFLYIGYWAVGIALSVVVYRLWERPWMDLRERWIRKELPVAA
jgi:peptidoglycan/LPS O-acetylase OafA/YrhL